MEHRASSFAKATEDRGSEEHFDYAPFDGFDPFDELRAGRLTAGSLRVFHRIYDTERNPIIS